MRRSRGRRHLGNPPMEQAFFNPQIIGWQEFSRLEPRTSTMSMHAYTGCIRPTRYRPTPWTARKVSLGGSCITETTSWSPLTTVSRYELLRCFFRLCADRLYEVDVINVVSVAMKATVHQWIESDDEEVQDALYWRQAFNCRTSQISVSRRLSMTSPQLAQARIQAIYFQR